MDIVNPMQQSAADMITIDLKDILGKPIILWDGINEQGLLINKEPANIQKHIKVIFGQMSKNGRYVANPSHNIQEDVPVDNIYALNGALNEKKL